MQGRNGNFLLMDMEFGLVDRESVVEEQPGWWKLRHTVRHLICDSR